MSKHRRVWSVRSSLAPRVSGSGTVRSAIDADHVGGGLRQPCAATCWGGVPGVLFPVYLRASA